MMSGPACCFSICSPRNAIQAADGHIYPIDPVIQRITPDFGQFLRDHPGTINLGH